jgi:hypothetical protein
VDQNILNRRQPLKNESAEAIMKARSNKKYGKFVRPSMSEMVDMNQHWRKIDL